MKTESKKIPIPALACIGHPGSLLKILFLLLVIIVVCLGADPASADKSAVRLEAPQQAAVGEKVTITLIITHNANNFFHYTQTAYLKINGNEVASWEFSGINLPDNSEIKRTFEYTMTGPAALESAAFCNLHGSANTATATIGLK